MSFSASTDGKYYQTQGDDIEIALAVAFEYEDFIYVGENREPRPPYMFFDVTELVSNIYEQEHEDYSHVVAEDWFKATPAQIKDINDSVRDVLKAKFIEHNLMPKFFVVDEIGKWRADEDGNLFNEAGEKCNEKGEPIKTTAEGQ